MDIEFVAMRKKAEVEFITPVTEDEKKAATTLRDALEVFVEGLDDFAQFFKFFQETVAEIESGKDLTEVVDSLVRYLYKLRAKFNKCVRDFSIVLVHNNELYKESKTEQIKNTVEGAFSDMRFLVIDLLKTCEDINKESFMSDAKDQSGKIEAHCETILNTVRDEWISHIDRHILGRTRL